ncbi:mitochondrial transcription rescue factor 1 isoform X1 [Microplitis mediator]|uniref:mitochondrial transcription rescue factor 1 isoform X1 n=1 Tax=Microplitis mediator TaxID=375433 RepID=UPI0025539F2C|nr:mitochondrial transcription rescue factor 1 isoform X1 [Microplitis mediator]
MATARLSSSYLSLLKLSKQLNRIKSIYIIRSLSSYNNNDDANNLSGVKSKFLTQGLSNTLLVPHNLDCLITKRCKSTKRQKQSSKNDDDSDDEEEELDAGISSLVAGNKNNKIVVANVNSMRIDAVVKAGMGIPRNQAETAFYESKLRVNGHKVLKKGHQIGLEDEIDYIHGPSPNNPDFLLVTRLTVLNANNQEDGYKIKLLREKSLTIENYDDRVKSSSEES